MQKMKLTTFYSIILSFLFFLHTNPALDTCFRRIINDVNLMTDEHAQSTKINDGKIIRAVLTRMNVHQRLTSVLRRGCSAGIQPRKRTFEEYSREFTSFARNHVQETLPPERRLLKVSRFAIIFALHFEAIVCKKLRLEMLRPESFNMSAEFQLLSRHYKRDVAYGGKYDQAITKSNKFQCIHLQDVDDIVNQIMEEGGETNTKHHGKRSLGNGTKHNTFWTSVEFLQRLFKNHNFIHHLEEIRKDEENLNNSKHEPNNVDTTEQRYVSEDSESKSRIHNRVTLKIHKEQHVTIFNSHSTTQQPHKTDTSKHGNRDKEHHAHTHDSTSTTENHSSLKNKETHRHRLKATPEYMDVSKENKSTRHPRHTTLSLDESNDTGNTGKPTHRHRKQTIPVHHHQKLKATTTKHENKTTEGLTPRYKPSKIIQGNHRLLRPHTEWLTVQSEAFSVVMVDAILRGYIIQREDLPCPVDVINELSVHLSHRAHTTYVYVKDIKNKLKMGAQGKLKDVHHTEEHTHQHRSIDKFREIRTASHTPRDACSTHLVHSFNISKPSVDLNVHNKHGGQGFTNYTMKNILKIFFSTERKKIISHAELLDICPALMMNIFTSSSSNTHLHKDLEKPTEFNAEKYGIATLCVFIISACSLLGAILVKISHTKLKQYTLASMIALSISCLLGDAFVHLLPFALGIHDHIDHSDGLQIPTHVTKLLGLLAFFYVFILTELIVSKCDLHSHHEKREISIEVKVSQNDDKLEMDVVKNNIYQAKKNNKDQTKRRSSAKSNDVKQNEDLCRVSSDESHTDLVDADIASETCPSEASESIADLKSLVWMIIVGDAVHNLADGLAIGAAFAQNLTEGLSTCIAVLCHELPHELGDFAVLLNSGLSVKRALFWNVLSGIPAFIGLYIGLGAGSSEETRMWILAGGTGMFIYVALSKLVPEMLRIFNTNRTLPMFLAINVGLLIGFSAMFMLAIFEHDIRW